jgi:hypothetical protein
MVCNPARHRTVWYQPYVLRLVLQGHEDVTVHGIEPQVNLAAVRHHRVYVA